MLPSAGNKVQRRWQVEVGANGDGRGTEDLTIRGQAAPDWRERSALLLKALPLWRARLSVPRAAL